MNSEITNNAIWVALGSVATALIAFVRSGRDKQECRIDCLLRDQGATNARLEEMAKKVGQLEGKVENLEHHRDELIAENKELKMTIDAQAIQLVLRDTKIAELIGTNTELYDDLNKVQMELSGLEKRLSVNASSKQSVSQ